MTDAIRHDDQLPLLYGLEKRGREGVIVDE